MSLKNTEHAYGLIAIWLHWIIAAAFVANYIIAYYMHFFLTPRTPEFLGMLGNHAAIGMSVLVFVFLRIIWRLTSQQPKDVPGTKLEHLASHIVHFVLYFIMIFLPLTGYMGTRGPSSLFWVIDIPPFRNTAIFQTVVEGWMGKTWDEFEPIVDFMHFQGARWVVSILVALHVGAALYHHFIRKDTVLKRMVNPKMVS